MSATEPKTTTQRSTGLLILSCCIQTAAMAYSGGEGTAASPYILSCKQDILELASRPDDYNKSFLLTADIDLEGAIFDAPLVAPDARCVPNFNIYERMFTGCFNGNGHVIEDLSIRGPGYVGFFGAVGSTGKVMHLGLRNVSTGDGKDTCVGMLTGINRGYILGCYAQGRVAGYDSVGGLVGYQLSGSIVDCFSRGEVEGVESGIGGLVGVVWKGTIDRCYAAVRVIGQNPRYCGGLIGISNAGSRGEASPTISDCFWDVEVSGISTGMYGLALNTERMQDLSTYLEAKWDFADEQRNGINDIWTQPEQGGYPVLTSFSGVAPVVLAGEGNWDNPHVVSTARELAAIVYHGLDSCYVLGTDMDLSGIEWSGPVLSSFQGFLDGQGHSIRGFRQDGGCALFGKIAGGATVTNLRLEECEVKATEGCAGCLAGENHGRIINCSVSGIILGGDATGALVGYNKGVISDCSVSGAVEGLGVAGGLAGENAGTMLDSVSRGAVSGGSNVGGLAGNNTGLVRSCYSTAVVVGYSDLGGLIGTNGGNVADCYARSVVAGAYGIGGLIGQNSSSVARCYSTGPVTGLYDLGGLIGRQELPGASVLNSFWDTDSSGIQTSSGGTGLPRARMQDMQTFGSAGWDFVGETANGIADVWAMPAGSYPELTMTLSVPAPPSIR